MNEATNWVPGLVVLAVGVVGALFFLFLAKRGGGAAPAAAPTDDLTARYQALLTQLRQHVANKHLLPEALWQTQKAELEQAAAQVLKDQAAKGEALKQAEPQAASQPAPVSPAAAPAPNATLKGALIGGGVVLFVVLVAMQLSSATTPREDGMPMSGATPPSNDSALATPEEDARLKAKIEAVRRNPDDVDALADAAVLMLRKQAFEEARPFVTRAMSLDPYSPKARVGRAVLQAVDGQVAPAMAQLEHLGRTYPEAYDARLFAGLISLEQNDRARAVQNLELYLAAAPAQDAPPAMRLAVQQLKEQLGSAMPPASP